MNVGGNEKSRFSNITKSLVKFCKVMIEILMDKLSFTVLVKLLRKCKSEKFVLYGYKKVQLKL